jgi:hypothetical protein
MAGAALKELQAAQNAQAKLDEISRAAEADEHLDAEEQRPIDDARSELEAVEFTEAEIASARRTIGIKKAKKQRSMELLAEPRQGVQYTSIPGTDPNWIPELQTEPQEAHSIATAWMGSTRRLAVSLRDWIATAIPVCCRCEETLDGAELRRVVQSICLAPSGPATHTPQEAPHFVSDRVLKYKEFLSGRTTPNAHAAEPAPAKTVKKNRGQ